LVVGALVTAQPAAASVTACGNWRTLENTHGRLEVRSCIRHTAGHYYSWGGYYCSDPFTNYKMVCNIRARQNLWYNATPVRSDNVSFAGIETG